MQARTALCRGSCCRAAQVSGRALLLSERARIKSPAVATNVPPHGAFRGCGRRKHLRFRAAHRDKVANTIGLNSGRKFRRRNVQQEGETTPRDESDHSRKVDYGGRD